MLKLCLYFPTLLIAVTILTTGCSNPVSFSKNVMPVLEDHCISCHSPGGEGFKASGFNVSTYESFMAGTKFGSVVNPGSGFSSTLTILIKHRADPSINMPKGDPQLTELEIETIKVWVDEGARDN